MSSYVRHTSLHLASFFFRHLPLYPFFLIQCSFPIVTAFPQKIPQSYSQKWFSGKSKFPFLRFRENRINLKRPISAASRRSDVFPKRHYKKTLCYDAKSLITFCVKSLITLFPPPACTPGRRQKPISNEIPILLQIIVSRNAHFPAFPARPKYKKADPVEIFSRLGCYSTLSTLPIHINLRQNKRRYWISYSDAFSDRLTVPVPSVLS